ncbi:MAG TPA: HYR domain-containing protein [Candidatus Krumholzibacteria bacterium]|nr:HYR domain-containing protein [Candidatus Krumholzibacteria bacterium]
MLKHLIRGGILLAATALLIYGCADNSGSPTDPHTFARSARLLASNCGEDVFLSQLSPVLPVWEDSIETWQGGNFLNTAPVWTESSTVSGYLGDLVPVLQQWQSAINDSLGSAVLDTLANYDPQTQSNQTYLADLSSLLASWETALETVRGMDFLPTAPVFQPDMTPPTIACLADTTIECADTAGVMLEFEVTATDDCDPAPVVTADPPSGSVFPVGATLVTITASDVSGNEASCSFTVNVVAAEPPVITSATASPATLWPPNHKMVRVKVATEVEDQCDPNPVCKIVDVTSNEPDNGTGDGDTSGDWVISDDNTVMLRAERSGMGSGRVYTLTVQCTDALGNSGERTVTVSVPHDQGGGKAK